MADAEAKATPIQLREKHGLDIPHLADRAEVAQTVVYRMYMGQPVTVEEAERVLAAISDMTGIIYTLDNVEVVLG